jgi:ABC-2 type transport system ATP-binding protein
MNKLKRRIAMLRLEHVSKTYAKQGVKAVDDLCLAVRPGEIFGFIGPNGAGKTTTIKMIAGILRPSEGTIAVNGHDTQRESIAAKSAIGFVPDNNELYERLTGMEYLRFMGDMYGVSPVERQARIAHYLDMFELSDAVHSQIRSFSRGMKQKLTIMGALLHKPPLWLLDEPLTGLDPRAAHLLKQEMRAHCDAGNTVFFSTQVLEVAEKLCDRIGIIRQGRLAAVGTMEELRDREHQSTLENIFLEMTEGEGE